MCGLKWTLQPKRLPGGFLLPQFKWEKSLAHPPLSVSIAIGRLRTLKRPKSMRKHVTGIQTGKASIFSLLTLAVVPLAMTDKQSWISTARQSLILFIYLQYIATYDLLLQYLQVKTQELCFLMMSCEHKKDTHIWYHAQQGCYRYPFYSRQGKNASNRY
jgi:hypothetical protein